MNLKPVTMQIPLWWDRLSGGTGSLAIKSSYENGVPSSQNDTTHMVNILHILHLSDKIGIVSWAQGKS